MRIEIIRKWLAEEIPRKGAKQGEVADYIGIAGGELSRFLAGKRENLTLDQIFLAAEFLGSEFPEDLFANKKLYVKKVPLRGTIAAGILRATNMEVPESISNIPYLPTDIFGEYEQYAYQLIDDSAEDYAPSQAFVIFVDFARARGTPKDGDIVRIEQTYLVSGRLKTQEVTEASLRRVEFTRDGILLRKLSSRNPNDQDIAYDPEDKGLVIRDLAIGYSVVTVDRPARK